MLGLGLDRPDRLRDTVSMQGFVRAGDAVEKMNFPASRVLFVAATIEDEDVQDVAAEAEAGNDEH